MIERVSKQIAKYQRRGVLLDSNLLLLLLVGLIDPKLIAKFKRTNQYREEEFDLLLHLLSPTKVSTTPHVATEVSNLADSLHGQYRDRFFNRFSDFLREAKESNTSAARIAKMQEFKELGFADAAISLLARRRLVITDDLPLAHKIERNGGEVVNFNNIRNYV